LDCFNEVVEHHHAALMGGQSGDQVAVESAGDYARKRARRISAQSIGDQPFLFE